MAHFPNCAYSKTTIEKPEIGMGATEVLYSDRHACTISRISESGKTFWMQRDNAIRTDKNGMSDSQGYRYEANPNAKEIKVSKRQDGSWKTSPGGRTVWLGVRDEHYDYSF